MPAAVPAVSLLFTPCVNARRSHKPTAPFLGCSLFLHAAPSNAVVITGAVRDVVAGWAAGATRSIAALVQPLRLVRLPPTAEQQPPPAADASLVGLAEEGEGGSSVAGAAQRSGGAGGGAERDEVLLGTAATAATVAAEERAEQQQQQQQQQRPAEDGAPEPYASWSANPVLPLSPQQLQQLLTEAAGAQARTADVRRRLADSVAGAPPSPLAGAAAAPSLPIVAYDRQVAANAAGMSLAPPADASASDAPSQSQPQAAVAQRSSTAGSTMSFVLVEGQRSSGGGSGGGAAAAVAGSPSTAGGGGTPPGAASPAPATAALALLQPLPPPPPNTPAVRIVALNRLCPLGLPAYAATVAAAAGSAASTPLQQGRRPAAATAPQPSQPQPQPSAGGGGGAEAGTAALATSLPVWLIHDETGSTGSGAARTLAELLPFPVYGIDMPDFPTAAAPPPARSGAVLQPSSLEELAERYADAMVAAQPQGPYCVAGSSVFSCATAFAVAVALEHRRGADVMLVLLDGPPYVSLSGSGAGGSGGGAAGTGYGAAPSPSSSLSMDPVYYSLHQTLVQHQAAAAAAVSRGEHGASGARPGAGAAGTGAVLLSTAGGGDGGEAAGARGSDAPAGGTNGAPAVPDLAAFAATLQSRGGGPDDVAALLATAASFRPPSMAAEAWASAVRGAVRRGAVLRRLMLAAASSPRLTATPLPTLGGPVAVVLPEDRQGAAFLAAARACCDNSLTALTLECRHGAVLATAELRRAAAAAVTEAVGEMLQML